MRNKERQSWFLIRKAFISSSIEQSFKDKMAQMDKVMQRARDINAQYEGKCKNLNQLWAKFLQKLAYNFFLSAKNKGKAK